MAFEARIAVADLQNPKRSDPLIPLSVQQSLQIQQHGEIRLEPRFRARPAGDSDGDLLVTVTVVNRTPRPAGPADAESVFQTRFEVFFEDANGYRIIDALQPYPEVRREYMDDEEAQLALLYRHKKTYAIGHACAADWETVEGGIASVSTAVLPTVELPSTTPDVKDQNGQTIEVSMAALAGLDIDDDGEAAMDRMVDAYEAWTRRLDLQVGSLPAHHL